MSDKAMGDVTAWLRRWRQGDRHALTHVIPIVYDELRRVASRRLRRERSDHTLDSGALVHETYLKLVDQDRAQWRDRAHFFAIAAQLMRRILVDHARRRRYAKRGGPLRRIVLEDLDVLPGAPLPEWLALDGALDALARQRPDQARIVELHFFGGMTHEEIAEAMDVSVPTVVGRWRMARAWLFRHLGGLAAVRRESIEDGSK